MSQRKDFWAQKEFWDKEHAGGGKSIPPLDSEQMSLAVQRFYDWLQERDLGSFKAGGIDMGCGKGRQSIGLSGLGVHMTGFDFSIPAIGIARQRRGSLGVVFLEHDATKHWPFESNYFDFGLDCFTLADIEDVDGRKFAAQEMTRVLCPGGHLIVYTLSTDDEYSQEMLTLFPASEVNSYTPPSGKFEKCFSKEELISLYYGLELVEASHIEKTAEYDGVSYACNHHWMIFTKK